MLDVKKISCGGREYPFLFGILSFAEATDIKDDNVIMSSLKTLYLGIKNGAESEDQEAISFKEFCKICDKNPEFMEKCKNAMAEQSKIVGELIAMRAEET